MLQKCLCGLIGIDYPIIQTGMGGATNSALAAAVSNAGGLGSLGTLCRDPQEFGREVARLKEMTTRPFALNQVVPAFLPEVLSEQSA